MPYLPTAQSWLENSTLLLSARPITTRITTKYTIARPSPAAPSSETTPPHLPTQPPQTKGHLILKTYDPVSGACLKYRTDKAAEIGRLVAALGRCGRVMAGLPEKEDEDVVGTEGGEKEVEEVKEAKGPEKDGKVAQGKGGGGGGGKKKKGKK